MSIPTPLSMNLCPHPHQCRWTSVHNHDSVEEPMSISKQNKKINNNNKNRSSVLTQDIRILSTTRRKKNQWLIGRYKSIICLVGLISTSLSMYLTISLFVDFVYFKHTLACSLSFCHSERHFFHMYKVYMFEDPRTTLYSVRFHVMFEPIEEKLWTKRRNKAVWTHRGKKGKFGI